MPKIYLIVVSLVLLILMNNAHCKAQIPFYRPFPHKYLEKWLTAYKQKYKEDIKGVCLYISKNDTMYLSGINNVSFLLFERPSYVSIAKRSIVVVYDENLGYIDTSQFNKTNLMQFGDYLHNDLYLDYAISPEDVFAIDQSVMIRKGDTLWISNSITPMKQIPCWKLLMINGQLTQISTDECSYISFFFSKYAAGVFMNKYFVPRRRMKYR